MLLGLDPAMLPGSTGHHIGGAFVRTVREDSVLRPADYQRTGPPCHGGEEAIKRTVEAAWAVWINHAA